MSWLADPEQALFWITRLMAVGVLIDALENLAGWREYQEPGSLAWSWLRRRRRWLQRPVLNWLCGFPVFPGLIALRGVGALLLVVQPLRPVVAFAALLWVLLTGWLIHLRSFPYGLDASHRLTLVIIGSLVLQRCAPASLLVAKACLWFIALQACLAYATAGWSKLGNPIWRSGAGLFRVLNIPMLVASPALAKFFASRLWLAQAVNWFAVAIECVFPMVLLVGPTYCWFFLGWGLLFHLINAAVLGLNKFIWVWGATYPAILYIVQ